MTQQKIFDEQEQYDKIAANLLDGEEILAVYDAFVDAAKDGFIGLTNKRFILQHKPRMDDNEKWVALTSIPYSKVLAISISVAGQEDYEVTYRGTGDDRANHAHSVVSLRSPNEPGRYGGAFSECPCSE